MGTADNPSKLTVSGTTSAYSNAYGKLDSSVQKTVDAKIDLLCVDERHPSLHMKIWPCKVHRRIYINMNYRLFYVKKENHTIALVHVGNHDESDRWHKNTCK